MSQKTNCSGGLDSLRHPQMAAKICNSIFPIHTSRCSLVVDSPPNPASWQTSRLGIAKRPVDNASIFMHKKGINALPKEKFAEIFDLTYLPPCKNCENRQEFSPKNTQKYAQKCKKIPKNTHRMASWATLEIPIISVGLKSLKHPISIPTGQLRAFRLRPQNSTFMHKKTVSDSKIGAPVQKNASSKANFAKNFISEANFARNFPFQITRIPVTPCNSVIFSLNPRHARCPVIPNLTNSLIYRHIFSNTAKKKGKNRVKLGSKYTQTRVQIGLNNTRDRVKIGSKCKCGQAARIARNLPQISRIYLCAVPGRLP